MILPLTLTTYESLGVLAYTNSLLFPTFRVLAEWLQVYQFIHPSQQQLRESALSVKQHAASASSCFSLWQWQLLLQNHYTQEEQANIIRYILCTTQD